MHWHQQRPQMHRYWHQQRQKKPSPWIALGVIFFSLYLSNYINSLQARPTGFDSVSNISDTERHFQGKFLPKDASSIQSLNSLEQSVLQQINDHRRSKGLPPLILNDWLTYHAREHSKAMASGKVAFDRQGLQQRNEIISQSGPYQKIYSLIAMNQGYPFPDRTAVNSWLKDPLDSSLPYIEGDYEFAGVGVAMNIRGEYYFTQVFLRR